MTHTPVSVLVSLRVDPVSGRATRSRADAAGVALALRALGTGREPQLLNAGALPEAVARDYLALGVSRLTRLPVAHDHLDEVVAALAGACRSTPLVIAGARGESGLASGLLPHALAQQLQRPLLADVIDLQAQPDGGWRVVQALPRGARRTWALDPGAAAVLVSSPRLAQRADLPLRHAWLAAREGRIEDRPFTVRPQGTAPALAWQAEPTRRQRRPLTPPSTESGAARMARATGTAAPAARAGVVLAAGSAEDKARQLLDHLRALALVGPVSG
jgi:electron transfer flavoprotein beta subunit